MALTKVSTDGVKDDAITSGKIPANAVGASELADNAVDTNAIANNAVTAGKTSGVQTTINNNADNRVITGSGTANTLNGESSLTFDGSKLAISNTSSTDANNTVNGVGFTSGTFHHRSKGNNAGISGQTYSNQLISSNGTNVALEMYTIGGTGTPIVFGTDSTERMRIDSSGNVGIGTTSPQSNGLTVEQAGGDTRLQVRAGSNGASGIVALRADGVNTQLGTWSNHDLKLVRNTTEIASITANGITFGGDTAAANALDDFEEGTYTPQVIIGGGTSGVTQPTNRYGSYTKIGRRVFFNLWINGTVGYTGSIYHGLQITLPFTTNSNNASYSALSVWFYAGVTDEHKVISRTENNDNKLILQYPGDSIAFLRVDGTWNMMISGQFDT